MRDYARVAPTFWTRGSGKKLRGHPEAQVVALYLMTCAASNMIGLFYISLPTLAHETGLPVDRVREALARVAAAEIALYDEEAELVLLPEATKYQIGELRGEDKRIRGIEKELARFGDHPFVTTFLEKHKGQVALSAKGHRSGSRSAGSPFEAPSKPLRSPFEAVPSAHEAPSKPEAEAEAEASTGSETGASAEASAPASARHMSESVVDVWPDPGPPSVPVSPPPEAQESADVHEGVPPPSSPSLPHPRSSNRQSDAGSATLVSSPIVGPSVGRPDLLTMAAYLADRGNEYAQKMLDWAAGGRRLTKGQREAIERVYSEHLEGEAFADGAKRAKATVAHSPPTPEASYEAQEAQRRRVPNREPPPQKRREWRREGEPTPAAFQPPSWARGSDAAEAPVDSADHG